MGLWSHWDESSGHSFYSHCMTLGAAQSPVTFAAAVIHVLSARLTVGFPFAFSV